MELIESLLTPFVLSVSAGIVAIMYGIAMIPVGPSGNVRDTKVWKRVAPIIPLLLGVGIMFAHRLFGGEGEDIGSPVMTGLWAGFVASHGRKLVKRLVIEKFDGNDEKANN